MPSGSQLTGLISNRYEVEKRIGQGGMGEVYLVRDRVEGGARKALKVIHGDSANPGRVDRFKLEFRTLMKLSHPNLVKVYDFEVDPRRALPFYTADYIPGLDFHAAAKGRNFLTVVELAVQVCRALAYIHDRDVVHLDLKPGNVLVLPDENLVKLVDFGLHIPGTGMVAGTPGFIAPELIRGAEVDGRADLYSLGVMLYHALAGRPPFQAEDANGVLRRQLGKAPPSPREFNLEIPIGLDRLVMRLIEREPSDRHFSAREVIRDINESLGMAHDIDTPLTASARVLSPKFVGRDVELRRLEELFSEAMHSDEQAPVLALLVGERGMGKACLTREMKWRVQLKGAAWVEWPADRPRGDPRAPIQEIRNRLAATLPDPGSEIEARKNADAHPESGAVESGPRTGKAFLEETARHFVEVSRRLPLVLVFRSLQELGASSLGFMQGLARTLRFFRGARGSEGRSPDPPKMMILATLDHGPEKAGRQAKEALSALEPLNIVEKIEIGGFVFEESRELVASMMGPCGDAGPLAEILHGETGGSPLKLKEAMRLLTQEGVVSADGEGPAGHPSPVIVSGRVDIVSNALKIRAGKLEGKPKEVLDLLAVLKEPVGLGVLAGVLNEKPAVVLEALAFLEKEGFAARVGEGGLEFAPAHAEIRDAVTGATGASALVGLHRRVAEYFENRAASGGGDEYFGRLAIHFAGAHQAAMAKKYALIEAERLEGQGHFHEAAKSLELALASTAEESPIEKGRLGLRLGKALFHARRYAEAVETLEWARTTFHDAFSDGEEADLLVNLGWCLVQSERYPEASKVLQQIKELDSLARDKERAIVARIFEARVLMQTGKGAESRELCRETLAKLDSEELLSHRPMILDLIANSHFADGNVSESIGYFRMARDYGLEQENDKYLFSGLAGLTRATGDLADFDGALKHGRQALEVAERLKIPDAIGLALATLSRTLHRAGRSAEAEDAGRRGIRMLECAGSIWNLSVALVTHGDVLEKSGKLDEALNFRVRSLEVTDRLGDSSFGIQAACSLSRHYLLRWECSKSEEILDRLSKKARKQRSAISLEAFNVERARSSYFQGRLARAVKSLEEAIRLAGKRGESALWDLTEYRLLLGEVLSDVGDFSGARECLAEATGVSVPVRSPGLEWEGKRALGKLRLLEGDRKAGERLLMQAASGFRDMGHEPDALRTSLLLASSQAMGGETAQAKAALRSISTTARKTEWPGIQAEYGHVKGLIDARSPERAEIEEGIASLRKAAETAARAKNADLLWRSRVELAGAFRRIGAFKKALEQDRKASRIFETMSTALGPRRRSAFDQDPRRASVRKEIERVETILGRPRSRAADGLPKTPFSADQLQATDLVPAESLAFFRGLADRTGEEDVERHVKRLVTAIQHHLNVQKIGFRLRADRDVGTLASFILEGCIELSGARRAFVLLFPGRADLEGEGEEPITVACDAEGNDLSTDGFAFGRSAAIEAARTQDPLVVADASKAPGFGGGQGDADHGIRSAACVPLVLHGESFGAIYVDDDRRVDAFSWECVRLLTMLAGHACAAIVGAQKREAIEREKERAENRNRQLEKKIETKQIEIGETRFDLEQVTRELKFRMGYGDLVGRSPAMLKIFDQLEKIVNIELPVLVLGPTGSGKELVVRAIHVRSKRRDRCLVTQNCAAIPDSLVESELFGYVKGAFTGASENRKGLMELADGGTLFLDEIGDMSRDMQAKLLRALEQKEIRRVGSTDVTPIDIRLITATNRDLCNDVEEGRFRRDLYYRLNAFSVTLPSLKERSEDIPLLIRHFLEGLAQVRGTAVPQVPPEVLRGLLDYDWPGNVRQLRNELERLLALSDGHRLSGADFSPELKERSGEFEMGGGALPTCTDLRAELDRHEINIIRRELDRYDWNVTRTAKNIGISLTTIKNKIKEFGLKRPPR